MKSKALFLLVAFLLNTAVGFACAVQMDTFGHHHHNHHHHSGHQGDNCCKTTVNNLVTQAKVVPEGIKVFNGVLALSGGFEYDFSVFSFRNIAADQLYFADPQYHPPIKDIRIAIQSFQI